MSDEVQAKELFLDALERPPGERLAFARAAAGAHSTLAARVEALLAAHERAEKRLARPPAVALVPGLVFGPYRLVEPLGEGGFGAVWRARQEEPVRREVALKILRAGAERGDGLARFELERQTLATLTHPGIAQVHEGGTAHGRPWFAMELVAGVEITVHAEREALPLDERLELFAGVCRALQHAHQRGIIHRDIKPSNVLVSVVDGVALPKVIDFGIAHVESEADWTRRTRTGELLGTPAAMSPEQLAGSSDVDLRADVYALGVLLYELLVGAPPFDAAELRARGPSEALRILREVDPPPPSLRATTRGDTLRSHALRGELDWIVMRCLEKDRERRYASVAELVGDLERLKRGEPVLAGPPSRLYRARKFAARHALLVSATAFSLVALAVGTAFATLEANRARAAEVEASANARAAQLESGRYRAIAEFFEHVLLSIDPAIAQGRDTALLEDVLGRAVRGLADRPDQPPEVEATLRRSIGGAYAALAQFEPALEQLGRALELRRAALGEEAPDTVRLEAELAGVLAKSGRLAEAEALFAAVLPRVRRTFGEDDERTLELCSTYAAVLRSLGRTSEALELLAELHERLTRLRGADHDDTLLVLNNLALGLDDAGRHEEAAVHLRALMELQGARLGDDHPRTLAAIGNYASVLDDLGREEEAEQLLHLALERKLRLYGPGHPSVIVTQNNLAKLLERLGRPDEARVLYEETLPYLRPGTDQAAHLRANLGTCLRRLGRVDEALPHLREALSSAEASVGPGAALTRSCAYFLGDALLDAGLAEEAEPLVRRALENALQDPDAPSGEHGEARLRLGLVLAALGQPEEARIELTTALREPELNSERRARAEAILAELDAAR